MKFLLALITIAVLVAPAMARDAAERPQDQAGTDRSRTVNHWHVSTYWAEHLEGHGPGNHALYCGDETIPACDPPDTIGGVGRDWLNDVEWRRAVADPRRPVTVRLTGIMHYDLPDHSWDFLYLYVQRGEELELLDTWTGSADGTITLDYSATLTPEELSGPGANEVWLVWRVLTSLDGWDDEDCINPSHGACQIDDLSVYLDGALITFDGFEPGSTVNWDPVLDVTAVDDLAGLAQVSVDAFPNPFNPHTTIAFDLPRAAAVSLAIYDAQGRLVRQLVDAERLAAGHHRQAWDGRDAQGRAAASGIYVYRLDAGPEQHSGKLTMMK